jgi:transcriptional regulator with XRE-family HTH domain
MGRPKTIKPPIHQKTMLLLWRTINGFSQADVASGLKKPVSTSTISRLEDGLLPYNQELLEDIAEFLNISVLELMHINPLDVAGSTRHMLAGSRHLRDGLGKVAAESFATYDPTPGERAP